MGHISEAPCTEGNIFTFYYGGNEIQVTYNITKKRKVRLSNAPCNYKYGIRQD